MNKLWSELVRIFPLLLIILAAIVVFGDVSQLQVQLYQLSMVAFVIIAFHIARQVLFPYIDIKEIVAYTKYNAIASAMVFVGMLIFIIVIIYMGVIK
jgi:cytochrome bd-type quinol oxidase subunit 2